MVKVFTVGVFDYFHYGHLKLIERAKQLGDYLIVGVQEDSEVIKYKPNTRLMYNIEERIEMVESIRYVDQVISYKNVYDSIRKIEFDIFVVGGDQNSEWFEKAKEYCISVGKRIIVLERTPGICSSDIKKDIHEL